MGKNKRASQGNEEFYDSDQEYLELMYQLKKGSLHQDNLKSKSIEFESTDFSDFKNGCIEDDYIRSHDTNIHEIDISPSSGSKVKQEYIVQHDERIEEPKEAKITVPSKFADNELEPEEVITDSRIPFDVQVKRAFLEKRAVRCCGSIVFLYNDEFGYYEEQTETSLHVAIRQSLSPEMDMKLGKHKIADVVHRIVSCPELQVNHDEFDSHTHLINFRNCVFDVNKQMSYLHSPDYLFTSYIDAGYGEPPPPIRVYNSNYSRKQSNQGYYFTKFLEDCTESDQFKIKSLQQLTGYIISNEWRAKKFFVLIGLPHTGKSVWLALWRSLIGPKHTTAMSLKQLGESRFMTAELFKSKLNISAEMDENGTIKSADIIKTITGGDLLTAEKKGKDPFQFYGKTKLVAAGNHMPLLNKLDGTSAFTDRILFLMFSNTIPEERRDKTLMDKLINEKTYIVEWALDGLRELMKNNLIFTESEKAHAFKLRYINEINNVSEFVRDWCHIDLENEDCKVHRKTIYPTYKQYCRDNGYKAISKQEFFIEILKMNVKSGKFRVDGSTPLQGFRGMRLLTKTEQKLLEAQQVERSTLAT